MQNCIIQKDEFETIIQSERVQTNNETGKNILLAKEKDRVIAIIPKECIIIETQDLTKYQQVLRNVLSSLDQTTHNDKEKKNTEFDALDFWKECHRIEWLNYFQKLYGATF
jgi:hypothetical protein